VVVVFHRLLLQHESVLSDLSLVNFPNDGLQSDGGASTNALVWMPVQHDVFLHQTHQKKIVLDSYLAELAIEWELIPFYRTSA